MGKRKKHQDSYQEEAPRPLKPETKKAIYGVVFFVLTTLTLLSLFDLAGQLGEYLAHGLSLAFGISRWLIPVALLLLTYSFLARERESILGKLGGVGLGLFLLSWNALVHIIKIPFNTAWQGGDLASAGGYVGTVLAIPLLSATGKVAAIVIVSALIIISLLLIFNTTLHQLGRVGFFWLFWLRKLSTIKDLFQRQEDADESVDETAADEAKSVGNEPASVSAVNEGDTGFEKKLLPSTNRAPAPATVIPHKQRKIDIPLDLLDNKVSKANSGDIKANGFKIKKTLQNFGIETELGEVSVGPTVTQFTVKPAEGVKLSRITGLSDDLALALAAHPIRIEAPIPGKSLVGIEVPNQTTAIVSLKEVLTSAEFIKRKGNLMIALGKDVSGNTWLSDLASMPHLLIAGATGSGKTICINSIIVSLLYQNGPDDLKFLMIDPKRVELHLYNGVPHLISPVITDVKKTVNALKWCLAEMDRRFEMLSKCNKRDIASYNRENVAKMPYLIVIIDELADLMATSSQEVEGSIIRLSQMARAVGIHLILATQRPSVDVITGLIKANITSRIAFSVASIMDSRTILDTSGAEKLLGRGDMLFISAQLSRPKRLQGVYVSEDETKRITNYLKEKYEDPDYDTTIIQVQHTRFGGGDDDAADDTLYEEAKMVVIQSKKASASLLQRRLKVGYARAARLIDMLEEHGVVGPGDGAKPREILVDEGGGSDMIEAENEQFEEAEHDKEEYDETEEGDEQYKT